MIREEFLEAMALVPSDEGRGGGQGKEVGKVTSQRCEHGADGNVVFSLTLGATQS